MPNWNEVSQEIEKIKQSSRASHSTVYDKVRRNYLAKLHKQTKRNIIIYYSGWLQAGDRAPVDAFSIVDHDKIGFMSACNNIDRKQGLDLILHTPGGGISATESIVEYLHQMFEDIRVIVPQLAMSAGTMIACAANSIVMGKQSSLGPIDPQYGGLPAHGIIEEFNQAHQEIKEDPTRAHLWQPIIHKYRPTLIGECTKAIDLSEKIVKQWLINRMFHGAKNAAKKADKVVKGLGDHASTLTHDRHLSAVKCKKLGLVIKSLEESQDLQDAVLSLHHSLMHTLSATPAVKIIENHNGQAFINHVSTLEKPPSS